MKNKSCFVSFVCFVGLIFGGCSSVTSNQADPAQVAKLTAVATVIAQTGVSAALVNNPESREQLLAIAEAIEQAAALPEAPPPSNLINLTAAAAAKFGGPYGAVAGLGLQAGLAIYQQLYAANAASALDKQPAFKAVLLSLAGGIRSAVQGIPAASVGGMSTDLSPADYVLRSAR